MAIKYGRPIGFVPVEAERRRLAQRIDRKHLAFVPGARMRHHLGGREIARRCLEGLLLLAEGEVHLEPVGWATSASPTPAQNDS